MLKSEINALLKSKSDMMKEMSHGCTSIEWKCVINRKGLIDIYNGYSESHFKIIIDEDGDIEVKDELMEETITYLINGDKWYEDFQDINDGIDKAINAIFSYFYDRY